MLTVTYNGVEYTCATAYKGDDSVRLVDENGVLIADFEGVQDFSLFTCVDEQGEQGYWSTCPREEYCYPILVGADGKSRKSSKEFDQLASLLDYSDILSAGPEEADTPSNWHKLGFGLAYIREGKLRNQPCDEGFLLNLTRPRSLVRTVQVLIRAEPDNPCGIWMRKNLVTAQDVDGKVKVTDSSSLWDNDEQWVQVLDENYQRATIRLTKTANATFNTLDSLPIFSTIASTSADAQTGNLTLEQRTQVENWDGSGSNISSLVGVRIGDGINKVRVSMMARLTTTANGSGTISCSTSIFKVDTNGDRTIEGAAICHLATNRSESQVISTIMDVKPGDFIFARFHKSDTTNEITLSGVNKATQMVVEAIG